MPDEVHVFDIGTVFRVTLVESSVPVDISSVTLRNLSFQEPIDMFGATKVFSADFTGVGTDGIIQYKTGSGDINQVGVWKIQAHVQFINGDDFRSEVGQFRVFPNL